MVLTQVVYYSTEHECHVIQCFTFSYRYKKGKATPVTDREGPWGCEMSRLQHFLDNWLTDGGKLVSLMHQPPFTPQKHFWYSFMLEAESTVG
jgi:hypothetical protein